MNMENLIKEATGAMVNLNMFAAIVALTENGLMRGAPSLAASKIRTICLKEQQRQLEIYDNAVTKLKDK